MLHLSSTVSNMGNTTIDEYTTRLGMRRFSARSLILSVLLGSDPPRLPVAALIDFCSLFEIAQEEFAELDATLTQLLETDLPALEAELDAAGVPWTPGRGVPED